MIRIMRGDRRYSQEETSSLNKNHEGWHEIPNKWPRQDKPLTSCNKTEDELHQRTTMRRWPPTRANASFIWTSDIRIRFGKRGFFIVFRMENTGVILRSLQGTAGAIEGDPNLVYPCEVKSLHDEVGHDKKCGRRYSSRPEAHNG